MAHSANLDLGYVNQRACDQDLGQEVSVCSRRLAMCTVAYVADVFASWRIHAAGCTWQHGHMNRYVRTVMAK